MKTGDYVRLKDTHSKNRGHYVEGIKFIIHSENLSVAWKKYGVWIL